MYKPRITLKIENGKSIAKFTLDYPGVTSIWQAVACHKLRVVQLSFRIIMNQTLHCIYLGKHDYTKGRKEVIELTLKSGYKILD